MATQNFDFDPQKKDRDLRFCQQWKTHGVFLGRDHHLQVAPDTAIDEILQFRVGVTVMIDVALGDFDLGAELAQSVLKAVWCGNCAKGTDVSAPELLQWLNLAGHDILEMQRFVRALDNFRGAIVTADSFDQLFI